MKSGRIYYVSSDLDGFDEKFCLNEDTANNQRPQKCGHFYLALTTQSFRITALPSRQKTAFLYPKSEVCNV